jgi:hypothetical protein
MTKHLENIDGFGTYVNRESTVYANYMGRWKSPPTRFWLWVNALAFAGYTGWVAYSAWKKAKLPKHRPLKLQDRPAEWPE